VDKKKSNMLRIHPFKAISGVKKVVDKGRSTLPTELAVFPKFLNLLLANTAREKNYSVMKQIQNTKMKCKHNDRWFESTEVEVNVYV
jgi:hypothetical protein